MGACGQRTALACRNHAHSTHAARHQRANIPRARALERQALTLARYTASSRTLGPFPPDCTTTTSCAVPQRQTRCHSLRAAEATPTKSPDMSVVTTDFSYGDGDAAGVMAKPHAANSINDAINGASRTTSAWPLSASSRTNMLTR
jgi:hypothetical protein